MSKPDFDKEISDRRYELSIEKLRNLVESKLFSINFCNLSLIVENLRAIDERSLGASYSTSWFAKLKHTDFVNAYIRKSSQDKVYIKIGFSSYGEFEHEALIYLYLSTLLDNRTPNLMQIFAYLTCFNFDSKWVPKDLKRIPQKADVMIIERGVGCPLSDIEFKGTPKDALNILFQIFYTLREMNLSGVRHNDLHFGNVWYDNRNLEPVTYYVNSTRYFQIIPNIKIFDFDRATLAGPIAVLDEHVESEECAKNARCPNFDTRPDFFKALYHANSKHRPKWFRNVAYSIFKKVIINRKYDWRSKAFKSNEEHLLCMMNEIGDCTTEHLPVDGFMNFTNLIDLTDVFDCLEITGKPTIGKVYRSIVQ